jgi:hypothetical protein
MIPSPLQIPVQAPFGLDCSPGACRLTAKYLVALAVQYVVTYLDTSSESPRHLGAAKLYLSRSVEGNRLEGVSCLFFVSALPLQLDKR